MERSSTPPPINPQSHLLALCDYFGISPMQVPTPLSQVLQVPIIRSGRHRPTHLLALRNPDPGSVAQMIVPIDSARYDGGFSSGAHRLSEMYPPSPTTEELSAASLMLRVVPLQVPDPASMPLLLIFGMGFETNPNTMGANLLPGAVIGEFPHLAEMVNAMVKWEAREVTARHNFISGLWKNVLATGFQLPEIHSVIESARGVAGRAYRIQNHHQLQRQKSREG
ncbi:hypothetical protein BDN72DRAFT_89903 [Pluteus cervinus]|uniref:Uncharacterized protein n=1 Tax=Pluteus cervinus TaxID=181527 RepID=A0ACD3AQ28_9AGAR|nr:hypothetical protein BDN72DRAFT_89903 [Pluteus cervinus]